MKSKRNGSSNSSQAKNLVRGALSRLRASSTPKTKREVWQQEQQAQNQINRAISIAKQSLDPIQFASFEEWVLDQISNQNRNALQLGKHLTSLGLFPTELNSRDLTTELRFAADQLHRYTPQLEQFAKEAAIIESAIHLRNWSKATATLIKVQEQAGYSYWSMETKLALIQVAEGVEPLKSQISLMSVSSVGLTKFFLYFFGVRNEPAQTSSRFKANLKKRVDELNISKELKEYSKFRLYGNLEANQAILAQILACEQLTTPIDLLFTTIKVTRFILDRENAFSHEAIDMARQVTTTLLPISSSLGISSPLKHDEVTDGIKDKRLTQPRLLHYAQQAIRTSLQPREAWDVLEKDALIIRGLASQLSTRSDGLHAEELAKVSLNLGWLSNIIEIGDLSTIPLLPKLLSTYYSYIHIQDKPLSSINDALRQETHQWMAGLTPSHDDLKPLVHILQTGLNSVVLGMQYLNDIANLPHNQVAQDTIKVVLANITYEQGNVTDSIRLCANAGIDNDRLIPMLPLIEMFQNVKWSALLHLATSIDFAISLDHFLRIFDDRKIRTYKRYSVEELMRVHMCLTVVDLPAALFLAGVEKERVEYFTLNVCDPVTIELLPGMGQSRKTRMARSQLLRAIAELHTNNEPTYLREAEEIEDSLLVDDGIDVLDDSKVYVDEQAILNSVNQELSADFQRYLKLVESGLGISDSFADVLKSFKAPSAKTFQIPKNDADDLLTELVGSIMERFLFDPASGLDIIIGRRIRHGTISSELRGVLEAHELIGQRPRIGANYAPPARAISLCTKLETKQRRIIYAALSRFSESIDQLIGLLRDEYFHVRSKSKVRGIFDVQVNPVTLALARSIAQSCKTIDQFSKECVGIFWFFLSTRAEASRVTIEAELKKTLHSIFSKLTSELRALNALEATFFAQLQQISEELQRRASTIASWIRVPKISVEGKTYSMQHAIDVAVAVVTGQHPGFRPIISSVVPENLELDTHGFSIVEDALYIALDNIYQHSGKRLDNKINIEIIFNTQVSLLSFSIINEVVSSARNAEKETRLNTTRIDIQRRAYGERARLDRGSGLCKLAAIVMQSDKTNISFGYQEPDLFKLQFDLVYIGFANDHPTLSIDPPISDLEVDSQKTREELS